MNVPATKPTPGELMENVVIRGDLDQLTPDQRVEYYHRVCSVLGLNPLTQPLAYIRLQGKLTLYVRKDGADQLRKLNAVSVTELTQREHAGIFIVTAKVEDKEARRDIATGAVPIDGLRGEPLANACMKAETKAKRRATLSICGLGFLDETEIEEVERRPPRARENVMRDAPEQDLPPGPRPAADAASADEGSPPQPPAEAALFTHPDESTRLQDLENGLAAAAEKGTKALEAVWGTIAVADRQVLVGALDRRFKPRARAVDAIARQTKST